MRPELDPSEMAPDERHREIAEIIATSLRRLRDRAALVTSEDHENPGENRLEAVSANPLTVTGG